MNLASFYSMSTIGGTGIAQMFGKTIEVPKALVHADETSRSRHILTQFLIKLKVDALPNVYDIPDDVYRYIESVRGLTAEELIQHARLVLSTMMKLRVPNALSLNQLFAKLSQQSTSLPLPLPIPSKNSGKSRRVPRRVPTGLDKVIDCTKTPKTSKTSKTCRGYKNVHTILRNRDGCRSPRRGKRLGSGQMGEIYQVKCSNRQPFPLVWKHMNNVEEEFFLDEVKYQETAAKKGVAPAIVDVYLSPGSGVIVMRQLEGVKTFREYWERIAKSKLSDKSLRSEAVRIARKIGSVVAKLHSQGIYHGDVHDENVMIDKRGRVWLIDFGLAGRFDNRKDRVRKDMDQIKKDYLLITNMSKKVPQSFRTAFGQTLLKEFVEPMLKKRALGPL